MPGFIKGKKRLLTGKKKLQEPALITSDTTKVMT
jgi:hypothetical protein